MRAMGVFQEWHSNGGIKISAHVIGGTADLTVKCQGSVSEDSPD